MARLTYWEARSLARVYCFNPLEDYCAMSSGSKQGVLDAADSVRYRKPKNANGSRGRYFAAYVRRVVEKGDK